jgi:hypothetical protein
MGITIRRFTSRKPSPYPGVPASWHTSQSVAADLHRRMHRSIDRTRRTLVDARRCGTITDRYEVLCDDLADTAAALDTQLVTAADLPLGIRHKVLLGLRYQIAELERTGDRIGRTALEAAAPVIINVEESLRAINERLDLTIEARAEARRLGA